MNPLKLTFTANEQDLTKTDNFTDFASNTVSYIEATFTLGENWSGYDSVRAVWKTDYYTISTVLDANFTCIVPTEVLRYKAKVFVNLVGSIVENDTLTDRLTTFPVLALTVKANAAVNGSETAPVTPSQFEQFVERVQNAAESISDYSYDSEAWAVGKRGGVDVPSTDETYHNNSKYWAEQNAGLSDGVADLKEEINRLETDGKANLPLNWQSGWINEHGVINNSTQSKYALIPMHKGDSITVRTPNTYTSVISSTEASSLSVGDSVTPIFINYINHNTYSYIAQNDINIVVCVNSSDFDISSSRDTLLSDVADDLSYYKNGLTKIEKPLTWQNGYVSIDGTVKASSLSQYAVVPITVGQMVKIGTHNANIAIVACALSNSVSVGDSALVLKTTSASDNYEEVVYVADQNINIILSVLKKEYNIEFYEPTSYPSEEESIINNGFYNVDVASNGSFSQNPISHLTPATNRIRTGVTPIRKGEKIVIENGSLRHGCGIWKDTFSTENIIRNDQSWHTEDEEIEVEYDGFIVVVFSKYDDTSISAEDFDGEIKIYTAIFNSLLDNSSEQESDTLKLIKSSRHILSTSNPPLTILHFTDLHKDTSALSRIVNDLESFGQNVADAICTGDMVGNEYEQIASWWDSRIMTCIGNHDAASYSSETGYNWTALSMADRDSYYIAPFESEWGITHTAGTSYYYKDYTPSKVRLIVMDAMLYNDNGVEATAQTAWLSNLLSDAISNELHVLIAIHSPHGGASPISCSFTEYGATTMPTYTDCNTPQVIIDTVANAKENGLKFIGYICGHTHRDVVWDAEGDGEQLMYCATTANVVDNSQWQNADLYRGIDADAYNLITIDTSRARVKIVRGGGANISDFMNPRKAICFYYPNGAKDGEIL